MITQKLKLLLVNAILLVTFCCSAQNKQSPKSISVDVASFQNSAHHWYDIFDKTNVINPIPDQPKYKSTDLIAIGDNILLYQKDNGGWPKNYDMLAIISPSQKDSLLAVKKILNTTFDNSTTYPLAPPIWTRYYELKTHRPLFCNRDSKLVYSLAEVDRERRDGYGWYTYEPQKVLDKYAAWKKKWAENN